MVANRQQYARSRDREDDDDGPSRFIVPPVGGNTASPGATVKQLPTTVRIFPYGVSRSRLDRAIAESHVPALIARDVSDADVVVALKATYKREPGKMREATQKRLPVYMVKSNTYAQINDSIREIFRLGPAEEEAGVDSAEDALLEAQEGIDMVKQSGEAARPVRRQLLHAPLAAPTRGALPTGIGKRGRGTQPPRPHPARRRVNSLDRINRIFQD